MAKMGRYDPLINEYLNGSYRRVAVIQHIDP